MKTKKRRNPQDDTRRNQIARKKEYEIEKNEDTRFLYGNWREMRYSVCLKPSSQEQE